jgi:hypothetical protein
MPTKRKVAVITDAIGDQFYFAAWHRYYASHVGAKNLYVVSYSYEPGSFSGYELGGLWRSAEYLNANRVKLISSLIAVLLESYELVIRVDTDEFIVPDPRTSTSLADYLDKMDRPYVTAAGYDIVQATAEAPLDLNRPILIEQRKFAYAYDALSKTCVVSLPVKWAPGFHFCTVFPEFSQLYLLHMKRADIDIQMAIGKVTSERAAAAEPNRKNYLTPREHLIAHNRTAFNAERGTGWDFFVRENYFQAFRSAVRYTASYGGVYHGREFRPDKALVELPAGFAGMF